MFTDVGPKKTSSQQLIKEANMRRIFALICINEGISRAGIAASTGLSPTTVSTLADGLISSGLVIETGAGELATSGRKPIMLEVNPGGGAIIAADLQKNGYYLGIFNLKCQSLDEVFIPLKDYEALGSSIVENTAILLEKCGYGVDRLLGICVGAPGIIDRKKGRVVSSTIIPLETSNLFYEKLKKAFPDVTVEIMNESGLCAYAESQYGAIGRHTDNLLYIDIHAGIGAGIIINGSIYEGSGELAGEFGHISIDLNGPVCKCGSRGCLEILASIPALVANIESETDFLKEHPETRTEDEKLRIIAMEYIGKKRYSGQIDKTAEYIAYGINNAINLINPGAVVIGGKITAMGSGFLKKVVEVQRRIGLDRNRRTKIIMSEFEGNPVTAGGARYIFNKIF
ncbi:MAG: ROK family transcriptional regulator [Clostridia bacterium]|nr:ROK family transcriptional regulator [Clostridia bacterium]